LNQEHAEHLDEIGLGLLKLLKKGEQSANCGRYVVYDEVNENGQY
jgi:hypothetical protein